VIVIYIYIYMCVFPNIDVSLQEPHHVFCGYGRPGNNNQEMRTLLEAKNGDSLHRVVENFTSYTMFVG
jgi:hypothetical protein